MKFSHVHTLTPTQEGILFHAESTKGQAYRSQSSWSLTGELDFACFQQAFDYVVSRHDTLRSSIVWRGTSRPHQVVMPEVDAPIDYLDWSEVEEVEHQWTELLDEQYRHAWDLNKAPLYRVTLVKLAEAKHRLLYTGHHILVDGWSVANLVNELQTCYQDLIDGKEPTLPPVTQFQEYVAWLNNSRSKSKESIYWKKVFQGKPATPKQAPKHNDGDFTSLPVEFDNARSTVISQRAKQYGVTVNTLVQLAWTMSIAKLSGELDICFGMTTSGRTPQLQGCAQIVGMCINTLPLRINLLDQLTIKSALSSLHNQNIAVMEQGCSSLVDINKYLGFDGNNSLFDNLVVFENYPASEDARDYKLSFEGLNYQQFSHYPLALLASVEERLNLNIHVNHGQVSDKTVSHIQSTLSHFLEQICLGSEDDYIAALIADYCLPGERDTALAETNSIADLYASFAQQAESHPDKTALVHNGKSLRFGELEDAVAKASNKMVALGIACFDKVAIEASPGIDYVIAMLATVRLGATYVPLDIGLPEVRIGHILALSDAKLVISDSFLTDDLPSVTHRELQDHNCTNAEPVKEIGKASCAIFFTSGSTGEPKGVQIVREAMVNLALNANMIDTTQEWILAQTANLTFDGSSWELWTALLNGYTLVIVGKDELLSPSRLTQLVKQNKVDVLFLTTSIFHVYAEQNPNMFEAMKYVVFGGEQADAQAIATLAARCKHLKFVNGYGPTEATTFATSYTSSSAAIPNPLPIGQALPGLTTYVLNAFLEPVDVDKEGELYLGGLALAAGYCKQAKMTAEKFVPDPYSQGRLYRTGDIVKRLADGNLQYLRRNDSQVKLRGFRIETNEIQTSLRNVDGVKNAHVSIVKHQHESQLIAYVVSDNTRVSIAAALKPMLPAYMFPHAIVLVESFPLTENGKLDTRSLPIPSREDYALELSEHAEHRSCDSATESDIKHIWQKTLNVRELSTLDNFFTLGGDSLSALRMLSQVGKAFSVELTISEFALSPTVKDLAQRVELHLGTQPASADAFTQANQNELSAGQRQLWFVNKLSGINAAYNISNAFTLKGKLDIDALQAALKDLQSEQRILSTVYPSAEGQPQALLVAPDSDLSVFDLRLQHEDGAGMLEQIKHQQFLCGFDLEKDKPIRASLVIQAQDQYLLFLTVHHIAADGWSMPILFNRLSEFYKARRQGQEPKGTQSLQFADFSAWQRQFIETADGQALRRYWQDRLENAPLIHALPLDKKRPSAPSYQGGVVTSELGSSLSRSIFATAAKWGITPFSFLLGVYAMTIAKFSGEDDIVIGTPAANRGNDKWKDLIGCFVNILPVRVRGNFDQDANAAFTALHEQIMKDVAHQAMPFDNLIEHLEIPRSASVNPLYQLMFVLQPEQETAGPVLEGIGVEPIHYTGQNSARVDLLLQAKVNQGTLSLDWEYARDLFSDDTVNKFAQAYGALCQRLVNLDAKEAVVDASDGTSLHPQLGLVPLLQHVVEQHADKPAVIHAGQNYSYQELWSGAARTAAFLTGQGIKLGDRVMILAEASPDYIKTLLGVCWVGAIYVPIDSKLPRERVRAILSDCEARCVLHTNPAALLDNFEIPAFGLAQVNQNEFTVPPVYPSSPEHLAYIMYTSGSTGVPKGVGVPQRGILRLVKDNDYLPLDTSTRMPLLSQIGFDGSTLEIWGPLLNGGGCHIFTGGLVTVDDMRGLIADGVDTLFITTALFNALIDADPSVFSHLKYLMFGGEQVSTQHVQRLIEHKSPALQLKHVYGPTENTTFSSCFDVKHQDSAYESVPIGKAIKGTQAAVLDDRMEPVPQGAVGELYLGGRGLAHGYWQDTSKTARFFVPHPTQSGQRLYRTGDLVKLSEDNNIHFVGRKDRLIKLRGFRIELEEIEAAMLATNGVKQAAVELCKGQHDRLMAFYATDELSPSILANQLAAILPDYMLPGDFIKLEQLPLNSNGKIDRTKLMALVPENYANTAEFVQTTTQTEKSLAALWADLLDVSRSSIGKQSRFFELGGNSLIAIKLQAQVQSHFGIKLQVEDVFKRATLAELASFIDTLMLITQPGANNKKEVIKGTI